MTNLSNVALFLNPTREVGNWQTMNGDLATVLGWASGDLTLYGFCLVYI